MEGSGYFRSDMSFIIVSLRITKGTVGGARLFIRSRFQGSWEGLAGFLGRSVRLPRELGSRVAVEAFRSDETLVALGGVVLRRSIGSLEGFTAARLLSVEGIPGVL